MPTELPKVVSGARKNSDISPTAPTYRIAGIEINTSRPCLTRDGEEIPLRPKTYQVLLVLIAHCERMVTKEELIDNVWEGMSVTDDVLVRCIADLRKAFGDDTKDPRIFRTFPKLGYGLIAPVEELAAGPELVAAPVQPDPPQRRWWLIGISAAAMAIAACAAYYFTRPEEVPGFLETAWWKLDEGQGRTVTDATGNTPTGQLAGSPTWLPGILGQGLSLQGPGAAVTGKANHKLPAGDSPRTITAWIRPSSTFLDDSAIFEYGDVASYPSAARFSLSLRMDGLTGFGSAFKGGSLNSRHPIQANSWHMVTATYEGAPKRIANIYVDGKLDSSSALSAAAETGGSDWAIGRFLESKSSFNGMIDDIRVFPSALPPARVEALYRCSSALNDSSGYYFMPVLKYAPELAARGEKESSASIVNTNGNDQAGIQLARPDGDCGGWSLRGANVGQHIQISVDLLTPSDAAGHITEAGPFFRSRRALAGEGIMGGQSAGYWVQLDSTGVVRVKCLNPWTAVAISQPIDRFDPAQYHHMEVVARGEALQVQVDGTPIPFQQNSKVSATVSIPEAWAGPPRVGKNEGAAGIAFAARNRGAAGGQVARNFVIKSL